MTLQLSSAPEDEYLAIADRERRGSLGQHFTPWQIASFMAAWVGHGRQRLSLLDPAIGVGVFARALAQYCESKNINLVGYDIDRAVLRAADASLGAGEWSSLTIRNEDFLLSPWEEQYDAILCNPPYLRFQQFLQRDQVHEAFQRQLGASPSGLSNIYGLFIAKAQRHLALGGRASFIVPTEFLNANYGRDVKADLLTNRQLRYILELPEGVFPGVLTTACILLFAREGLAESVGFISVQSEAELLAVQEALSRGEVPAGCRVIGYSNLNPKSKWGGLFQQEAVAPLPADMTRVGHFGRFSRGIATGHNEFFVLSESQRLAAELPSDSVVPIVSRAADIGGGVFTISDWERLLSQGKKVWLFAPKELSPLVEAYVAKGEELGVRDRYLCKTRPRWYCPENRDPAALWATVFHRTGLRLVRNAAAVRNLTTFHGFYPNSIGRTVLDAFRLFLMSDLGTETLKAEQRKYGGGLLKFEPNDLNSVHVPRFDRWGASDLARASAIIARFEEGEPFPTLLRAADVLFRGVIPQVVQHYLGEAGATRAAG